MFTDRNNIMYILLLSVIIFISVLLNIKFEDAYLFNNVQHTQLYFTRKTYTIKHKFNNLIKFDHLTKVN